MAKVSIIIPTYNVEAYLEECMESVVNQTLKDIEIICVNDGSTDTSPAILKKYADKDNRIVLINQENGGYGKAMNVGLERAAGEYIGIVEPDDYVPLHMYQELYERASAEKLDFVKADFYRFTRNETGNMELFYNHLSQNPKDYNVVFDPSQTPEAIRFIMNTWSGIYRKSFLKEHQIRHNETPGASFQDNGFWFQTFIYAKKAMIIDKPYYRNRRDNPNSSINSRGKVYCINAEYDFIRDILMRSPEVWERFKPMYWFKKYSNYYAALWRIGPEYKHEYLLRFSAEFKRGLDKNELKKEVFSSMAWSNIQRIVSDPEGFYEYRVAPAANGQKLYERIVELETKNQKLTEEIARIRKSKSFRIGSLIMYIPKKLRKVLSKNRKR